jgi:hypothetical protein
LPLKERLAVIEMQIVKVTEQADWNEQPDLPNENEIRAFAQDATPVLGGLSFDLKRSIVLKTIEKVVGTQEQLQVYGYIPIKSNVALCSDHRHGANSTTLFEKPIDSKRIPFYFEIKLPPPLKRGVDYGFRKGISG